MNKQESIKILTKCLSEIESMSQEEFDERDKQTSMKEYSEYVIDKINNMSDEEFEILLDKSGINDHLNEIRRAQEFHDEYMDHVKDLYKNKEPTILSQLTKIPDIELSESDLKRDIYSDEFWDRVNQVIENEHIRFEEEEKLIRPTHEQRNKEFDL